MIMGLGLMSVVASSASRWLMRQVRAAEAGALGASRHLRVRSTRELLPTSHAPQAATDTTALQS